MRRTLSIGIDPLYTLIPVHHDFVRGTRCFFEIINQKYPAELQRQITIEIGGCQVGSAGVRCSIRRLRCNHIRLANWSAFRRTPFRSTPRTSCVLWQNESLFLPFRASIIDPNSMRTFSDAYQASYLVIGGLHPPPTRYSPRIFVSKLPRHGG